jgi:hypothetical protein
MILYCTSGYPGHDKEAPALGVVTKLEQNSDDRRLTDIHYELSPLCHPIPLAELRATIPGLRTDFRLPANQLQTVPRNSFRAALAGR